MIAAAPGRLRDLETIAASRLFDEAFYLGRNPDVAASGVPALLHYVMAGAAEGRDPHPLFSTPFYVSQVPGLDVRDRNPLHHYLTQGWRAGYAPHPLFDPQHYLAQHEDAAAADVDPLTHYLAHGAAARANPHPRFDVDFYLREHPDVHEAGVEPLTHFVVAGNDEGRRSHPSFDLETREAREIREMRETRERDERGERRFGTRIELTARSLAPRQEDSQPTILVVSHVGPWRPRAGNEYRVQRMLRWYQRQGYRVIPVIAPLPGEELPREGIDAVAEEFGHVIQVHRDGRIEYVLRDFPDALASLDGTFTSPFADLLAEEEASTSARERELLNLERTFCHDAVISTVLHLQRALGPHILQVEYIWMTRLLPLVRGQVLKVVDTHDVFSSIAQKVRLFGVRDVNIEPQEEAARLRRADLAIAIQDDETGGAAAARAITSDRHGRRRFRRGRREANARRLDGSSTSRRTTRGTARGSKISCGWRGRASISACRTRSCWSPAASPRRWPAATCAGVRVLGLVDDLTARYQEAALVINPVVAGTGLKIKMLEALCHLRPIVTWPAGVDGLDRGARRAVPRRDRLVRVLRRGDPRADDARAQRLHGRRARDDRAARGSRTRLRAARCRIPRLCRPSRSGAHRQARHVHARHASGRGECPSSRWWPMPAIDAFVDFTRVPADVDPTAALVRLDSPDLLGAIAERITCRAHITNAVEACSLAMAAAADGGASAAGGDGRDRAGLRRARPDARRDGGRSDDRLRAAAPEGLARRQSRDGRSRRRSRGRRASPAAARGDSRQLLSSPIRRRAAC